jgi:exosortase/archaeosortase family protein
MVIRLQQITTSMSSVALDLLGVPHAIENNVIRLASRDLFVAEACSGIQSVFTLMFMATLVVAINRRLLWLTPIYVVIAMLLAIFANVLRVTTVAVGDVWLGMDLADGWQHDLIGYAALGLGCLFLLSFDQLLVALLHPIQEGPGLSAELNPLIHVWNFFVGAHASDDQNVAPLVWLFTNASARGAWLWRRALPGRALMVVSSVLLLASIGQAIHTFRPIRVLSQSSELIFTPSDGVLDSFARVTVHEHETIRDGDDPRLGDNADVWTCRLDDPDALAQLVVSQPYADWHELCWCYTAQNWTLLSRVIRDPVSSPTLEEAVDESDHSGACPFVLARFRFGDNRFAYLFYSAVDRSGEPVDPPLRIGRLQGRFGRYLEGQHLANSDLAMIQLLVVSDRRFGMSEVDRLSSLFSHVRRSVLRDAGRSRIDDADVTLDGAAQTVTEDAANGVSP